MKRAAVVALGSMLLAYLALAGEPNEMQHADASADRGLPPSLDALYPPRASSPTWLMTMLGIGTSLSGMVTDFLEGDFANAEHGYGELRSRYASLGTMVPEWQAELPVEPIDALGPAIASRDPDRFMQAVERAVRVCHACHVENMARVQYRYHWGDFGSLEATDPISRQDVPFTVLMQMLDGDLSGVEVDTSQGQLDQARTHVASLASRYEALTETCSACHDTPRSYYVDASITELIGRLHTALSGDAPDAAGVHELVARIGNESCHRCHLVHGPAALARYAGE